MNLKSFASTVYIRRVKMNKGPFAQTNSEQVGKLFVGRYVGTADSGNKTQPLQELNHGSSLGVRTRLGPSPGMTHGSPTCDSGSSFWNGGAPNNSIHNK